MNIKKINGFALIDVIVAIILTAAIAGAGVTYVFKQNTLSLTGSSCQDEAEFFAHAKACGLVYQANNKGGYPKKADILTCLQKPGLYPGAGYSNLETQTGFSIVASTAEAVSSPEITFVEGSGDDDGDATTAAVDVVQSMRLVCTADH
jgi:hypothetical protein